MIMVVLVRKAEKINYPGASCEVSLWQNSSILIEASFEEFTRRD
jgi:hypothetical protein